MDKIRINILGSCVLRDAVEFSGLAKENIAVDNFFQSNSAVSLGSSKLSEVNPHSLGQEDFAANHPCWYRWFMANSEEKVYDRLKNSEAQYLFTSLDECAYGYYSFKMGEKEARLCPSAAIKANDILKKLGHSGKLIHPFYEKEKFCTLTHDHCQRLRRTTAPEKIIFVDFVPAQYCLEKNGISKFCADQDQQRLRSFLQDLHHIFEEIIPEAKIIKLPATLLGDANHKWGKGTRHFIPEIYDFIALSLLYIMGRFESKQDEMRMELEKTIRKKMEMLLPENSI